jgi:copper transport protein
MAKRCAGLWTGPVRQVLLLFAALLLQTGLAAAHASLNSASPSDRAVVAAAPSTFSLTFSEPVSPLAITLIRPDGTSAALGDLSLHDTRLDIAAPKNLGRGTHVLSWRVVSADGHPIGGSVVFSIGEVSSAVPVVAEAVDWPVRAGLWLARIGLYAGLFLGAGGVFAIVVLMPGCQAGTGFVRTALVVGVAGAVPSLGLQGLDALGAPLTRIADPAVWSTGLSTSYGSTVVVAVIALLLGFAGLAGPASQRRFAALLALGLVALAPALSGHASAASPQWLMRPSVFVHALGIALWTGALVPLGLALRRRETGAMAGLARFSKAMPPVLALLVTTGLVLAVVQVEAPAALLATAYGQLLLAKLALLVLLFMLAAANRWLLTDAVAAGDTTAAQKLVRAIAAETLIVVLVFGVAAAWRFTPPPRALAAAAAQPATTHIHTAQAMADLSVTPGRTGTVSVTAALMAGDFGPLEAKEVRFVFANPAAGIEPFDRPAIKAADYVWRAHGIVLPLPGTWTVRIDILITDYEMARLEGEIAIAP